MTTDVRGPSSGAGEAAISLFRYDALTKDGVRERGTLSSIDRMSASRALQERGLHPLALREARRREGHSALPMTDLAVGLRTLGDLTSAGMPIARALEVYSQIAPAPWATVLPGISAEIRQGQGLSAALAAQPGVVSPSIVAMIRASERGEGLSHGLVHAAAILEERVATRRAIVGALTYPIILASVGVISVAFLIGVVLPRLAGLVTDLGQALPPTTRALLLFGRIGARGWAIVASIAALGASAFARWVASVEGSIRWHGLLLRAPLVGAVRRATTTVSACATMGALLETGVPIATALAHAADASTDTAIRRCIELARADVMAGAPMSRSLAKHGALSATAIQLIRVGEENGRMSEMLRHAARIEHERAVETTRTAVRLVEPVMILLFGGIVAFVAAALLQAVYSIRPA